MAEWKPLAMRIIEALRKHPEGLSSRHLSQILIERQGSISSALSKMSSYGNAPLERLNANYGPRVIWRLNEKKPVLKVISSKEKLDERRANSPQPTTVAHRVRG